MMAINARLARCFHLSTGGNAKKKFSSEAVKSLTDHPRRFLRGHESSQKHLNATMQYEGISSPHFSKYLAEIEISAYTICGEEP